MVNLFINSQMIDFCFAILFCLQRMTSDVMVLEVGSMRGKSEYQGLLWKWLKTDSTILDDESKEAKWTEKQRKRLHCE